MPTFVLSTGRTGTVFIKNVLNNLSGVNAVHERNARTLRFFQTMGLNNFHPPLIDKIYDIMFFQSLESDAAYHKCHFEINPPLRAHIEKAVRKFPHAAFIHVIRDPRTLVASGINWSQDKIANTFFKLYLPFWRIRPCKYELGCRKTDKLFEVALLNWTVTNREYAKLKNLTDQYHVLKFEELTSNPIDFIQIILKIANCRGEHRKQIDELIKTAFKNPSTKNYAAWQNWEAKYAEYLHKKCGELMQQYGYGLEREWLDKIQSAKNDVHRWYPNT
jgi:hypothetical protein